MGRVSVVALVLITLLAAEELAGAAVSGKHVAAQGIGHKQHGHHKAPGAGRHEATTGLEEETPVEFKDDDGIRIYTVTDGLTPRTAEDDTKWEKDSEDVPAVKKENVYAYGLTIAAWFLGYFFMRLVRTGITGEGGFDRIFGSDVSDNTNKFRSDNEIELIAFVAMGVVDVSIRFYTIFFYYRQRNDFHGNVGSPLKAEQAGDSMLDEYAEMSLEGLLAEERKRMVTVSYRSNREYMPPSSRVMYDAAVAGRYHGFDVPLLQKDWLQPQLDEDSPDKLRLLARFFYVNKWAQGHLEKTGVEVDKGMDGKTIDDEKNLLDLIYVFRVRCFKLGEMQFAREVFKPGDTDIPIFKFEKNGTARTVVSTLTSYDYIMQEVIAQEKMIFKAEADLADHLRSSWQNLGRYSEKKQNEDFKTGTLDRAVGIIGFFLIFLGLVPSIRVYTAADPECMTLVNEDQSVIQGLPRHGPVTDRPHPPMHNSATWSCGNNNKALIAGDITCHLQCRAGYIAMFGDSYCRNLGGAGTEFTHLLTASGLPQTSTPLDAPACCIVTSDAATLRNFDVSFDKDAKKWDMVWGREDGFPHACGSRPRVHAQICVAASNDASIIEESRCDKACGGFGTSPTASTNAKCFSSGPLAMANPEWSDLEKTVFSGGMIHHPVLTTISGTGGAGGAHADDKKFITLNDNAVQTVNARQTIFNRTVAAADSVLPDGAAAAGGHTVMARLLFDGSIYLGNGSVTGGWQKVDANIST